MTQQAQHTQHNAQQGDLANIKDLSVSFMTDATGTTFRSGIPNGRRERTVRRSAPGL